MCTVFGGPLQLFDTVKIQDEGPQGGWCLNFCRKRVRAGLREIRHLNGLSPLFFTVGMEGLFGDEGRPAAIFERSAERANRAVLSNTGQKMVDGMDMAVLPGPSCFSPKAKRTCSAGRSGSDPDSCR
jgi:hypothetical protein